MERAALSGVTVIDFGWVIAGPLCTKHLADLGATVIRVESGKRPDSLRVNAPYAGGKPGLNRSGYFAFFNANKYSFGLNLTHPKAIEVVRALVAKGDVLVENFTPGVLERMGLGYESLRKVKPDLIMISLGMQGQTGPFGQHRGYGIQLTGLLGYPYMTGWPDGQPIQPYGALTDVIASDFAAFAVIAALLYRRRTGKGQYLDLSQIESCLHFLAPVVMDYQVNGREPVRSGNAAPDAAPHAAYRCKGDDSWCTIAVRTDEEWAAFCSVLGNPEWTNQERFATLLRRKEHETELNRLVEEWTASLAAEDVMLRLQSAGVPAGVVQSNRDLCNDPQLKARNHFWKLEHPEMGQATHLGQSFQMSRTPIGPVSAAPCLGEHTEYVCRKILEMADDEFVDLIQEGVLL